MELALLTPVVVGLMLAGVDFGRVSYYAIAVTGSAHAGAQFGSQSIGSALNTTGMRTRAEDHSPGLGITATALTECRCTTATTVACNSSCPSGMRVYASVTATRTFTTVVNYPGIPNTIAISRTAKMRAQ